MIRYHGLPMGGRMENYLALQAKHGCVSFARPECTELAFEVCSSVMLDNGAFSVWKRGAELDLDGFAEWVERWHRHPSFAFYVMPDVIDGDDQANNVMRAKWWKMAPELWRFGVPVWHLNETLETLQELVSTFPQVALGSAGEWSEVGSRSWWSRIAAAMRVACDEQGRPKTRLHGLRMLDTAVTSRLPLASADSTNVARNTGIDKAWTGPYVPPSQWARAIVLMDRIENHATASRWNSEGAGEQRNLELHG